MFYKKQNVTALAFLVLTMLTLAFIAYDASAQFSPDLVILSPAGSLNPNAAVRSSFVVSFTVSNFNLVEPGQLIQVNMPNQGHVHVFLDGAYYAMVSNQAPIQFSNLQFGNHTIRLQLVNNDHSVLSPDVSKSITVLVTDDPTMDLTEIKNRLATIDSSTSNLTSLYYIAIGNIILAIIILIVVLLKK